MKMVSVKKPNNRVWNAKFAEQSGEKIQFPFLQVHKCFTGLWANFLVE